MKSMKVLAYVLAVVMIVTVVDFSNNYVTNAAEPTSQSQEDVTGEVESTAPETTSKIEKETKKNTVKKITPAAVKELKVTSVTTDKVSFRWKASKNATSYLVYRSVEKKNGKMTKAKKIKKVKTTSFTDSKLSQGTKYKYTVYAYRVAG
nr:fibronectin type III domain-containing protein [Eubacterium sp.]